MANGDRPINLWIHGSSGKMGREIQKSLLETPGKFRLVGGSARKFEGETFLQGRAVTAEQLAHALDKDKIEVVLDFSTTEANEILFEAVQKTEAKSLKVVLGTTGLGEAKLEAWKALIKKRNFGLLIAPNTSLGVLLTARAALLAAAPLAKLGFDIEITETHHRLKRDAPSGTARFLAETIVGGVPDLKITTERDGARQPGELGIHAVRGGGVFGEHEVRILGDNEEITISHRAFSRGLFAGGALVLARWLAEQGPGCYGLLDVRI